MKLWSTTPAVSRSFLSRSTLVAMTVLVASAGIFQVGSVVLAQNYEAQIKVKEQEKERYEGEISKLSQMAETLQGEVDRLGSQIADIQAQINESQAKHDKLVAEIASNEVLIEQNRDALGNILAEMYVDDQITPLEMLASSKSIGDYIDKQEQRASIKSALNEKIKQIKTIQLQLEKDRKLAEGILEDQKTQRSQVVSLQSEQQSILSKTQKDQNVYKNLVAERNSEIAKLYQQQAEENLRRMQQSGWSGSIPPASPGNGGYPAIWANAPINAYVDNWGMYSRQCVSYVAWKIANSGRYMPYWGGRGHAKMWPSNAIAAGIPTSSTPKVGSAAVMYGGPYGHIMYVEAVNGDGTITVSDYNLGMDGKYRYYNRSASGLTYIYF